MDYSLSCFVSDGIELFSCDICDENFTERIVLLMHKDINHSQNISQIYEVPSPMNDYTESGVKEEIKEEIIESDDRQGVEDSNLDTENLVDCSEYIQVQMNLPN